MTMSQYAEWLWEKAAEYNRRANESATAAERDRHLISRAAYDDAAHTLTMQLSHPLYWCDYVGDPNAPALKGVGIAPSPSVAP